MTDATTARRIAASLPEVEDRSGPGSLSFAVRGKQFAWSHLERQREGDPRVPQLEVLAVRCTPQDKELLLSAAPDIFFTTDR
jgi:hypothetical protein